MATTDQVKDPAFWFDSGGRAFGNWLGALAFDEPSRRELGPQAGAFAIVQSLWQPRHNCWLDPFSLGIAASALVERLQHRPRSLSRSLDLYAVCAAGDDPRAELLADLMDVVRMCRWVNERSSAVVAFWVESPDRRAPSGLEVERVFHLARKLLVPVLAALSFDRVDSAELHFRSQDERGLELTFSCDAYANQLVLRQGIPPEPLAVSYVAHFTNLEELREQLHRLATKLTTDPAIRAASDNRKRPTRRLPRTPVDAPAPVTVHDVLAQQRAANESLVLAGLHAAEEAEAAREAQRLAERVVGQLTDLTRARLGGGFELARQATSLGSLCAAVVEELRVVSAAEVQLDVTGDLGGSWDAGRLSQVLSSLASKAVEHALPGTAVTVRARGSEQEVVVEVTNEGAPIPERVLPHLFEAFRRGDKARANHFGLGLFIAHEVVVAHGGTLQARSSDGTTTFTVRLPRAAAPA